jgi:hypothetical protein
MKRSEVQFQKIFELRKKGKSYNEIANTLNLSKSTISYWLADCLESRSIKESLTQENRKKSGIRIGQYSKERWQAYRESAKQEAIEQFPKFLKNPLFIAGIMLYWGEGDSKQKNPLRLSNTSGRMVNIFTNFLRVIMGVHADKIKLGIILYPDLSDEYCREYWINVSGLSANNFNKTQFIRGRHPTKRLSHGICMIVVNSRYQKIKMLTWIDIFSKQYTMVS